MRAGTPPDDAIVLIDGPWTHRHVSANGIALHVAEMGSGPLVLLLHGFPQFWWTWRQQLVDLADSGHRAVAVDLRGYGASDKPPRGYDTPTLAADIAALVTALGERDAMVVGNDVGGLLAWTMAAMHPRSRPSAGCPRCSPSVALCARPSSPDPRGQGPCVRLRAARLPATPSAGIATHQGRDLRPATVRHLVRSPVARYAGLRRRRSAIRRGAADPSGRALGARAIPLAGPIATPSGWAAVRPPYAGSRLRRRSCTCTAISMDAFSLAPPKAPVAT